MKSLRCSAPLSVAVDVLVQGAESTPTDDWWEELLLTELSVPSSKGAQSCVKLQLPTEKLQGQESFLIRVRLLETFGDARYVCVYGLQALAQH